MAALLNETNWIFDTTGRLFQKKSNYLNIVLSLFEGGKIVRTGLALLCQVSAMKNMNIFTFLKLKLTI